MCFGLCFSSAAHIDFFFTKGAKGARVPYSEGRLNDKKYTSQDTFKRNFAGEHANTKEWVVNGGTCSLNKGMRFSRPALEEKNIGC